LAPQGNLILILLAAGLYGLLHSWLASLRVKSFTRRALGSPADRVYRLAYNVFAIVSLLPLLALPVLLPDHTLYTFPTPWTIAALLGQGAALLALLLGVLQTGLLSFAGISQLFGMDGNSDAQLVTSGLYRYVRHPLYTAGLLFIWLTPVMSYNLFALYLGLSTYLFIGAYFEERKLLREFGESYQEYRRRTPMFIPFLPRRRL
jgi:methanethiol S-methyltransferase